MSISAKRADGPDATPSGEPQADRQSLLADRLRAFAARFDTHFERLLTPAQPVPQRIQDAVRYAAMAPGKRLRPYLVVRCCELVGGCADDAWPAASAIECVHAFSLVHDDLPAMDDDNLRRGRPTCHIQFDEATAILAGDALVTLAFELLTRTNEPAAAVRPVKPVEPACRLVRELAEGTGWAGMIGGQMDDISGQSHPPDLDRTISIHRRKTARLFETACRLGALLGGADDARVDALGSYGQSLGRAFQIADDLLDVTGGAEALGKTPGKDASARKQTFPRIAGIEGSRTAARELVDAAVVAVSGFGREADDLRMLARFAIDRNN